MNQRYGEHFSFLRNQLNLTFKRIIIKKKTGGERVWCLAIVKAKLSHYLHSMTLPPLFFKSIFYHPHFNSHLSYFDLFFQSGLIYRQTSMASPELRQPLRHRRLFEARALLVQRSTRPQHASADERE
jgi:hypothetical protein